MGRDEVRRTIAFLGDYVTVHFTAEQKLMRQAGYPEVEHHEAEHAAFLTRAAAADNLAVFAQYIPLLGAVEDDIVACFKNGGGVPYARFPRFHEVMAEDSGQSVLSSLESHILPLVPGLAARLAAGLRALDVGCGRGRILHRLATLFPASRFTGIDLSADAINYARAEAARHVLELDPEDPLANVAVGQQLSHWLLPDAAQFYMRAIEAQVVNSAHLAWDLTWMNMVLGEEEKAETMYELYHRENIFYEHIRNGFKYLHNNESLASLQLDKYALRAWRITAELIRVEVAYAAEWICHAADGRRVKCLIVDMPDGVPIRNLMRFGNRPSEFERHIEEELGVHVYYMNSGSKLRRRLEKIDACIWRNNES